MEPRAPGTTQELDHQGCDALCFWPQNVLKREGFVKEQKVGGAGRGAFRGGLCFINANRLISSGQHHIKGVLGLWVNRALKPLTDNLDQPDRFCRRVDQCA